jgi:hypothetical protein
VRLFTGQVWRMRQTTSSLIFRITQNPNRLWFRSADAV